MQIYIFFCTFAFSLKNPFMKIFAHLILLCTPLMSIGQTDSLSVVGEPLPEVKRSEPADLDKTISKIWELDKEDQRGTFRFLEYLPMYALPFRFTDRPTEQPISLNPERPIPERRDYQHMEMKFQVSLKAKIMQDAFGKGDVWVAFTQQAYWGRCTMESSLVPFVRLIMSQN